MKYLNRFLYFSFIIVAALTFSVNAQTTKHSANKVALDGYCPVAYQAMNKALKGNPKYSSTYEGKTYQFAAEKAKVMFDKDPAKYLPKYDGYCATAMSMGKKLKSNPKLFTFYKDHTYLFSNKKAKMMFDKNPAMFVEKADKKFAALDKK